MVNHYQNINATPKIPIKDFVNLGGFKYEVQQR